MRLQGVVKHLQQCGHVGMHGVGAQSVGHDDLHAAVGNLLRAFDTSIDELSARSHEMLARYVELAGRLGLPAQTRFALGTDPVDTAARLCEEIAREVPNTVFFAGKIVFERETWLHRTLHNETAWAIQRRLQWAGRPMVVVPARVR